ncbi:TIGR02530 family flagellar biosynthesis protein [Diplocloster hominis]|uniref:TIGR02530 family flagellar biosynthesis protein n=1 Tax=Diplocloster hominis TaxID=3079010 RepID=UPI0031BA91DE
MDPILMQKRLQAPISTGNPAVSWQPGKPAGESAEQEKSFQNLLEEQILKESQVSFSRHALERVAQRNVDVSTERLERLNEGIRLAEEKGLKEPLILMDSTAFVVSVKNNRVITVVQDENLKGNVFTNIDGTVMI